MEMLLKECSGVVLIKTFLIFTAFVTNASIRNSFKEDLLLFGYK